MVKMRRLEWHFRRVIFIVFVAASGGFLYDILYLKTFLSTHKVARVTRSLPLCRNVLHAMQHGSWIIKPNLTREDFKTRYEMDVILRKHRGQPTYLNRSDFRCGINYQLSAPEFGPDIPALCMRTSDRHCCNANGLCSNGHGNCSCAQCTDFRKIVHAELFDWTPLSCQIMNYRSTESCAMVGERLTNLVVIGDSLMRHFYTALMLLFTDNPLTGALRQYPHTSAKCTGERQFVDRGKANCHKSIAFSSDDKKDIFCDGKAQFRLVFYEYYNLGHTDNILTQVKNHLNRPNSLIVLGMGMHDRLDADQHEDKLIDPILKLIGSQKWPRLIWTTTHAQGFLKPVAYRTMGQNNEKISHYNREMSDKLRKKGVDVFDVFPMTRDVHSYDGTHYGYGMNMIKARYLLNYIHQTIPGEIV